MKQMKDARILYPKPPKTAPSVTVDLRIPGQWPDHTELMAFLSKSCRVTPEALFLAGGKRIDISFCRPDNQFPRHFRAVCRQPPLKGELAAVDDYRINVMLSSSGGSMEAARAIMEAAAMVVRAGGAGVFIDNSILSHGGHHWIEMTEDGGIDAVSFAFVGIVQASTEIRTLGMHVLGLRDIVLKRADIELGVDVVEVIRSMIRTHQPSTNPIPILADVNGSWFLCRAERSDPKTAGSPMHNPFGRLCLKALDRKEVRNTSLLVN